MTDAMKARQGTGGPPVQSELDSLQRKYRMMEVNRKTFSEDSVNTVRMQRQQISKLKKDNERLKEDLALETRQAKQANNVSASAQISKLQDQAEMYNHKIEQEKRAIQELNAQIASLEESALQQRKQMKGVNAPKQKYEEVKKKIRQLENRLDKALVKFNEALAHNKNLRETIDNLRRERVVFDGIYRKLERELHEKKNKMAEIIEISNAAYEARDKAQAEMLALKSQADKEQQKFEVEWSQLGQLIEKDRKVKDFVKAKEREGTSNRAGDAQLEEEQKLRKQVTKGAWVIQKDKEAIKLAMEKVQSYEEAFAKIQKATAITDIDELVQAFEAAEDQNFQLFNYANDLTREIEQLEDATAESKREAIQYQGDGQDADVQRRKILENLDEKLSETESKVGYYETRAQSSSEAMEALKMGIQEIFDKLNSAGQVDILGDGKVTESNMMAYLSFIESRTQELLETYKKHENFRKEDGSAVAKTTDYEDDTEPAH